jgi:hypothetical protein
LPSSQPLRPLDLQKLKIGHPLRRKAKERKPTVAIKVNARRWIQVKNFLKSGPTDRHFLVKTTGAKTTVTFGDGVHGAALPNGCKIEATYRTGSGKEGEVKLSYRAASDPTLDQALWVAIRNRTQAIGFERYRRFINK